ncbi:S1 family peptidase [Austwickia chelonae]|uniref:S1 family peptidase n=1 Tax=Austwickia chelonae TaxID=100225 RepID=UPI000E274197|nr:S1 family peptidase [Austwickia chelonae]
MNVRHRLMMVGVPLLVGSLSVSVPSLTQAMEPQVKNIVEDAGKDGMGQRALARTVEELAGRSGTGRGEAAERLNAEDRFSAHVDNLKKNYAEYFSEARQSPDGGGVSISFKRTISASAKQHIADIGKKSGIKVSFDRTFSEKDVARRQDSIAATLTRHGVESFTVAADPRTQEIRVRAAVPTEHILDSWQRAARADGTNLPPVRAVTDPNFRLRKTVEVIGGADLQAYSNPAVAACTAAYVVTPSSGGKGLLTAGHCSDWLRYGTYAWLSQGWGGRDHVGDLQYHTVLGRSTAPWFVYERGSYLTVRGVRWPWVGQTVNRYGRASENWADTVVRTGMRVRYSSAEYYDNMAAYSPCFSNGGDSGGPVWTPVSNGSGGYAVGIHHGVGSGDDGSDECLFTPAAIVNSAWNGGLNIDYVP